MIEIAVFMALILPLPFNWRRKLFIFISENTFIAKVQYWLKVPQPVLLTRVLYLCR
jgi:B-cell receptor-associated protein 31